jgi:hypothetical protein
MTDAMSVSGHTPTSAGAPTRVRHREVGAVHPVAMPANRTESGLFVFDSYPLAANKAHFPGSPLSS